MAFPILPNYRRIFLLLWAFFTYQGEFIAHSQNQSPPPSSQYISLHQIAQQQYNMQLYQDALQSITEAIRAEPRVGFGYNMLGNCQTKLKQLDLALASFQQAEELNPQLHSLAQYNIGEIHFLQKDYAQAQVHFGNSLNSSKSIQLTRLNHLKMLLCCLKLEDLTKAREIQAELNIRPEDPSYHMSQAAFYFESGQVEAAHDFVRSIYWIYPPKISNIFLESFYELGYIDRDFNQSSLSLKTVPLEIIEKSLGHFMNSNESQTSSKPGNLSELITIPIQQESQTQEN